MVTGRKPAPLNSSIACVLVVIFCAAATAAVCCPWATLRLRRKGWYLACNSNQPGCCFVFILILQPARIFDPQVGPVSMQFEIPMYNVSNLQVRYLKIAEFAKSYNPFR